MLTVLDYNPEFPILLVEDLINKKKSGYKDSKLQILCILYCDNHFAVPFLFPLHITSKIFYL